MKKLSIFIIAASAALTIATACSSSSSCVECTISTITTKLCKKSDTVVTVTALGISQDITMTAGTTAQQYIDAYKAGASQGGYTCK